MGLCVSKCARLHVSSKNRSKLRKLIFSPLAYFLSGTLFTILFTTLVKRRNSVPCKVYSFEDGKEREKLKQFAIYSYSFGNYRNELKGIRDALVSFNIYGIDSYFFTDKEISHVEGWEIILIRSENMKTNNPSRSTGKMLKFQFHPKLQKYRYLIHSDAGRHRLNQMHKWLSRGLIYYVLENPKYALFIGEHPDRRDIEQEVNILFELSRLQPQEELAKWRTFLADKFNELNKVKLPQTCTWILDTHDEDFVRHWSEIYNVLNENGLWRDQVVFSYTMVSQIPKIKYISLNNSGISFWGE